MAIKEIFESNTDKIDLATELLSEFSDREGQYVWKKLTAQNGTFVDYVTADTEDAYPNGGTQDGYWYELVKEGIPYTGANPLTIGESGATLAANTLLEEALQIVNGVKPGINLSNLGLSVCEMLTTAHTSDTYTNWTTLNHNLKTTPKLLYVRAKTAPSGNCSLGHHLTHAFVSTIAPIPFAIFLGKGTGTYQSVGYNSTQSYTLNASSVKLGNCGIDAAGNTDSHYNNLNYAFAAGVTYEFYVFA